MTLLLRRSSGIFLLLVTLGGGLLVASQARAAAVIINEFMAANHSTLADEDGDFSDWIELKNISATNVALTGWFLTDSSAALGKWQFPATNLAAGQYLVIFASEKNRRVSGQRLHTNFRLGSDGGYLALVRPDGLTIESAFAPGYPKQRQDVSYGLATVAGTNGFLSPATPGSANPEASAAFVANLQFSHSRGFYNSNFPLAITSATPDVTIRYTTNGSAPSPSNGYTYTAPIPITGTTVIRAYGQKTGHLPTVTETRTYLFIGDVLHQSADDVPPPGWPTNWLPKYVYDYGMDSRIVDVLPWSTTISNDMRAIPSVSVVMALPDLFDATNGIYANAEMSGTNWERAASVELLYPSGQSGFQVNAGARIRGGDSRDPYNRKHGFHFICRDDYGASKLKFPFFGPTGPDTSDRFDLRTVQHGSWTWGEDWADAIFVNDSFIRDTALAMGQPGERGDWYHFYINGQYWGLYESCERVEANYGAAYFGGTPSDYDVLKPESTQFFNVVPADGNDAAWQQLWLAASSPAISTAAYFQMQGRNPDGTVNPAYTNLLDVVNLVDYMLLTFWGGNDDGPLAPWPNPTTPKNFVTLRNRASNTHGFRFISHDAEGTLLNLAANRVQTTDVGDAGFDRCNPQYLWSQLLSNAEFRQLFADRIQKHFFGNGALTRTHTTARFLACVAELDRAIVGESARWGDARRYSPFTRDDWVAAVNTKLTNYFPFRTDVVLDQLRTAGYFPALAAPALAQDGGQVPVGYTLTLTHTNAAGAIFYTLDGSDPRQVGGALNPAALNYGLPIPINTSMLVRARVKNGTNWSPLAEATFYPAQDFSGLRFTELMYNPLPSGATSGDEFEFLELKNTGTNNIDLGGCTFSAGITFTFTNGTQVAPGAFIVLGRNTNNFAARYPGVGLDGLYSGKLDNAGEKIALSTALGVEILALTYDDNSPWTAAPDGYGFSLVPINPGGGAAPSDSRLWRASANPGGSPRADDPTAPIAPIVINELLTHTDLPQLDSIELYNPTATSVDLGGWFLTDDSNLPFKFRIPNGTTIGPGAFRCFTENDFNPGGLGFNFSSTGETACVFSGNPAGTNLTGYAHSVNYGAAANGVSFGRYVNSVGEEHFPPQLTLTFWTNNSGPRIGPVVFTEIHYHPLTNDDEFIEIQSVTNATVALYDPAHATNLWRINGLGFTFPPGQTLAAGARALIVATDPAAFRAKYNISNSVPIWGPFTGILQNDGERLELQRPDNPNLDGSVPYLTVDEVRYGDRLPWPVAADGAGSSLQRRGAAAYGNDPTNWFAAPFTPGTANNYTPPIAPVLQLTLATPNAIFGFTAEAGVSYAVESRTNLTLGAWLPYQNLPAAATPTNRVITLPPTNGPACFFRVVVTAP